MPSRVSFASGAGARQKVRYVSTKGSQLLPLGFLNGLSHLVRHTELKGHEIAAVIATCRRWFEAGEDPPTLLPDVAKGGGIRTEQRSKAIWR
jgi:hypothetical protein